MSFAPAPLATAFFNSRWPLVVVAAMAALLFYPRLGCELLEPEEARYAEIPRQMLEHDRFAIPILHGEDYYQKPPLFYWLVMLSYRLFGVHDWAARLVPCTCGVLVVVLTSWWGRRTAGAEAGFLSGLIVCLSGRFLYLAGMVALDSLLCLWVVTALALAHMAINENRLTWWIASALACGLGVLTKGPVALALVIMPTMAWKFYHDQGRGWRWRWWLLYGLVTSSTAGPWFVVAALRDPEAAGTFFWLHNLVRYVAPFDHEKPVWFYVPGILLGMLPWSLLLGPLVGHLICRRWQRRARLGDSAEEQQPRQAAALTSFLVAFAWCLLFFSLSGCKRAGYIVPAFPLLALALGTFWSEAAYWRRQKDAKPRAGWRPITCCAGIVFVVLLGGVLFLLPDYHRRFGLRRQVLDQKELARHMPVVCYPKRWDSVSFYLGRDVEVLGSDGCGELGRGLFFIKRDMRFADLLSTQPAVQPGGAQASKVIVVEVRRP